MPNDSIISNQWVLKKLNKHETKFQWNVYYLKRKYELQGKCFDITVEWHWMIILWNNQNSFYYKRGQVIEGLTCWCVVTRQLLELFIERKELVAAHLIPLDGRGLSLPGSFQPAKQHGTTCIKARFVWHGHWQISSIVE